jgi:hypothetical protein
MATVTPLVFRPFLLALAQKKHDLSTDTLKWRLTNTAPSQTSALAADVTGELATGGGYTAGGGTSSIVSLTESAGVLTLILGDPPTWTGSGSGFGPFRYGYLINDTAASKNLICYYDHGSSITIASGQTYTTDLDQSLGILKLTLL